MPDKKNRMGIGCISAAGLLALPMPLLFYDGNPLFCSALYAAALLSTAVVILRGTSDGAGKLCALAIGFVLVIELFYIIYRATGLYESIQTEEQVRAIIAGTGAWGYIILFLLTLLQVVVLPIPAAITVAAGAWAFGSPLISFVISAAGTVIGSWICFLIGRKAGRRMAAWLIGTDATERYAALLSDKGNAAFAVMLLFPGFPDDILCIVAGLTNMRLRFFIPAIFLLRLPMLLFYSYFGAGDIIPYNTWWGILAWAGILLATVLLTVAANALIKRMKGRK